MATSILTDARLLVAGHDLSGQSNAVNLEYEAEALDATTFGQTTRIHTGGLKVVRAGAAGFWDSAATTSVDPVIFSRVGTEDVPIVIAPSYSAAGDLAYLFRAMKVKYSIESAIGELRAFDVSMEGTGGTPLVRGGFLQYGSATGNIAGGTAVELGAVAADKYLYAALHVFSGTGNFTVKIQSDDNSGFTSATDRITFTQVGTGTAVASEWTRVAGAITDTYWRITATNPNTRDFVVVAGIAS